MNSLNILSGRVSQPQTPSPSRTSSFGNALSLAAASEARKVSRDEVDTVEKVAEEDVPPDLPAVWQAEATPHEKTQLLDSDDDDDVAKPYSWATFPNRIAGVVLYSLHWIFSTLAAPFLYVGGLLYNDSGSFAPLRFLPSRKSEADRARKLLNAERRGSALNSADKSSAVGRRGSERSRRLFTSHSSSSGMSSGSESDRDKSPAGENDGSLSRSSRSKTTVAGDEIAPARRSIRIKLHNEDSLRQRKHRKTSSTSTQSNGSGAVSAAEITAATLKSPTSPASSLSLTKYPRAPAPPRPLIPARTPSYSLDPAVNKRPQKTLILDLDETLIHSMAKGGRMSTGHMVEVKLNSYIGIAGQANAAPQHPILYYVHKRPHCDDFLRRVCKWYNLVIFTASVQEYADPVIDWLETERKFFSGRFYRQHCTYRHGAFIKDLTSVEPDLSKVMILDNSPLSYMFHQDNAIPIEGWINDPTDNDLLHLVPLLEGLQNVTDVRALLALRGGEDGKHMTT